MSHVGYRALALAVGLSAVTTARAQHSEAIVPIPLRLNQYALVVRTEADEWAPGVGVSGLALLGPIELGLSATGETQFFGYGRLGLASHAGARARLARVELDLAGTAGVAFTDSGRTFLGDDPGAGGSIAFVGGRGGVTYMLYVANDRRACVGVGVAGLYEHDLNPYTVTYEYTSHSWFSDEQQTRTGSVTVGTRRTAVLLTATVGLE